MDADNMRYDARRRHVLVDYRRGEIPLRQSPRQAGEKDGAVAVLDLDGNNVAQIPTGGHPEALQREEKGNRIFIDSPLSGNCTSGSACSTATRWRAAGRCFGC